MDTKCDEIISISIDCFCWRIADEFRVAYQVDVLGFIQVNESLKMEFFNSVPFPFRCCHKIRLLLSVKCCLKRSLVLIAVIYCLFFFSINTLRLALLKNKTQHEFRMEVVGIMFYLFPPLIGLIIFVESFMTRSTLKRFPKQIAFIDSVMRGQIGIDMRLDSEKNTIRRRLISWLLLTCVMYYSCIALEMYYYRPKGNVNITVGWVFGVFLTATIVPLSPFIILELYFYRIVTFIDMVCHRYRLLNKCLRNFHHFTANDFLIKSDKVRELLNSDKSFNKLLQIRRVYRLLYWTSNDINDLFGWSLLVCIFFYFCCFFVIGYLVIVFEKAEHASIVSLTIFMSLNHIISLASACHLTSDEVRFHIPITIVVHFFEMMNNAISGS